MKKMITTFLVSVMVMSVMGVTVAAAATSTARATALQPTQLTITDYPKQVKVGQAAIVKGRLTSIGVGLGDKLIYEVTWDTTDHKWYWDYNFTTDPDGTFIDNSSWNTPGTYTYRYEFWGDAQYDECYSQQLEITVTQ